MDHRAGDEHCGEVTALLTQLSKGNQEAADKLIPLVYKELHRLAEAYMRRERVDHTLQPTALVHEAFIKLVQHHSIDWQSRAHFFGIAAQVMRRVLVDHARGHLREKRGGVQRPVAMDETLVFAPEQSEELLQLDEALERLAELDPRQGKIVELRFCGTNGRLAGNLPQDGEARLEYGQSVAPRRAESKPWRRKRTIGPQLKRYLNLPWNRTRHAVRHS